MPKLPKFEDWQAPWVKNGTEFDADVAAKLIYDKTRDVETLKEATDTRIAELTTKNTELQTTLDEKLREGLTAEEKAAADRAALEKKLAEAGNKDLEVARLEIALEQGLTLGQAKRLLGSTPDELKADAEDLVKDLGLSKQGDEEEEVVVTNRRTPDVRNPGRKPGDNDDSVSIEDALKLVPRI